MQNRESLDKPTIVMPSSLAVSKLEQAIYGGPRLYTRKNLEFDLSACQFIETPSLLYLIALLRSRLGRGLPTEIRLPQHPKVLQFLQIWRLPEAFEEATGHPLTAFTVGTNAAYFAEPPPETKAIYAGRIVTTDRGRERVLSDRFFEINSFRRQLRLFNPSLALTEAAKWSRVASVLGEVLQGPEDLLAPRIVYEALINAIRHPDARLIQIVSQIQQPARIAGSRGQLTISFWDDGQSIIDTLANTMKSGRSILSMPGDRIKVTYSVKVGQGIDQDPSDEETVRSDRIPNQESPEDQILLASSFPGTTSDPQGFSLGSGLQGLDSDESWLPGMGLYLLSNAAVSVYGGTVYVRTKRYRMSLEPPKGDEDFDVTIRHYNRTPLFPGNLLTIRLPLIRGNKEESGQSE